MTQIPMQTTTNNKSNETQPHQPWSFIDYTLITIATILVLTILIYFNHATQLELHHQRIHTSTTTAAFSSIQTTIEGQSKDIGYYQQTHQQGQFNHFSSPDTPLHQLPSSVSFEQLSSIQNASSVPTPSTSRHLLSNTEPFQRFIQRSPFKSPASMRAHYQLWTKELERSFKKHTIHGPAGFIEWLKPAVNQLNVSAARIGTSDYCLTSFDGREDPNFIFTLKHTFHLLNGDGITRPQWSVVLFVTPHMEPWVVKELKIGRGLPGEHIRLIRTSPINRPQANTLAGSRIFYESIPCEHIVYIQSDTLMVRSPVLDSSIVGGPNLFSMMHQYVFLGAPFAWCEKEPQPNDWCRIGGNGGASYRRRSVMLELTRQIACTNWRCDWLDLFPRMEQSDDGWARTEDTYFAKMLYAHRAKYQGRLARMETSSWYSMETHPGPTDAIQPYFVHKVWKYLPPERWLPLMAQTKQYYPQLWKASEDQVLRATTIATETKKSTAKTS